MSSMSAGLEKKITRKQKRSQHILEKETGLQPSENPTKNIAICNAGLVNGLTKESIIENFSKFGDIQNIILIPHKSISFVIYKNLSDSEAAFENINGKLNIGQYNKPLYLSYTENVPENLNSKNKRHPRSLMLIKDFISVEEEKDLMAIVTEDSNPMKHRKVIHYGYEFRYDINNIDKNSPLEEKIPQACNFIFERLNGIELPTALGTFEPDQLTINDYQPGQGIPPHIDTHSAFEDPILSLSLNSDVYMEFRHGEEHVSILLPSRSLLIMSGEARYIWTHGITPRKIDILETENGLTSQERHRRVSFTFRKVLKVPCTCKYPDFCDSQKIKTNIESKLAERLEEIHVHEVYEKISGHFSETRHKPWPNVLDFVNSFPIGSLLLDIGCGNGKYFGHNKNIFEMGCDRSSNLIEICSKKGFQAFTCNCLEVPLKDNFADGIISIAVIHHLANEERRLQAILEIVRLLKIGGRALIYVWAKNQEISNKKSNYLKQNDDKNGPIQKTEAQEVKNYEIDKNVSIPVHVNRTQFKNQDMLVPWKLKSKSSENQDNSKLVEGENLFLRFYHVFEEGELENMCDRFKNVSIVKSFYDEGNWCIILEKIK